MAIIKDWFCLDCHSGTELTQHGRCEKCGSGGVGYTHYKWGWRPRMLSDRQIIEKLDRVIIYLIEQRMTAGPDQRRWEACQDGIMLLKAIKLTIFGNVSKKVTNV